MVMNFWEAQRRAKFKTAFYIFLFILLTLAAGTFGEIAMRIFAGESYGDPEIPYVGLGFLAATFGVASFNYMNYLQSGGKYVAESLGARLVDTYTHNPKERQLLNIV